MPTYTVSRRRRPLTPSTLARYIGRAIVSLFIVLLALFPLAWMVIAGFKIKQEVVKTPFQFFPEVWNPQNYIQIMNDPAFVRTLLVTGVGAILFTLLSLTVNSLAAYAFARLVGAKLSR